MAENPEQHVHIAIPHGFNIGGARQPPGCLNSQHSHLTNEVFVVHSGTWAFRSGVDARDGKVVLNEGDVISLPTDVFRGFENVGDDTAFLYAILGEDDPGLVLWASQVFDLAKDYGLLLMEDGSLLDIAAGEEPAEGVAPMPRTTPEQVAEHRVIDSEVLKSIIIRTPEFRWRSNTALAAFDGVEEAALLGPASEPESLEEGSLNWDHGFVLRALKLAPSALVPAHRRSEEEVIFIQQGNCEISVDGQSLSLQAGDTFTTPIAAERSFTNAGKVDCIAYITRRTDQPGAPLFT